MTGDSRALLKLGALAALLAGGAAAAAFTPLGDYLGREGIAEAIAWLRGSIAAPVVYIAVYAVATALAIPGSVLTLAGGAMFGAIGGTAYTTLGANLGANAAFGIARSLGRGGVERLGGSRLEKLDRATESHGFRGLLTLRLIPAVPFNALNFGAGLTSMSWTTYASATAVGIFPGTVVYTMFADALLAGSQEASRDALLRVLLSGGLLGLLSFLPTIVRRLGVRVPGTATIVWALLGAPVVCGAAVGPTDARAQTLPTLEAFGDVLADHQLSVDYAAWKERRSGLDEYLGTFPLVSPQAVASPSPDQRLAFWVNACNACMLRLVIDYYPIEKAGGLFARIRSSVAGRPDNSVWQIPDVFTRRHCRVAGEERSQDEIEHELIRPMGEPRIRFAINCAAKSCPPLWPEAYSSERLAEQLDRALIHFIGSAEHFRIEGHTLLLNRVLDWFIDDFGGQEGLRAFLASYLPEAEAELIRDAATHIEFFEYDSALNDVSR